MDQSSRDAKLVYDYHRMSSSSDPPLDLSPADAIFCLCSLDTRVASRAADLYHAGLAPLVIFSGGSGKLTEKAFDRPEAEVFANIALAQGVPVEAILVERESTNTGENVRFTHDLLQKKGLSSKSFILVQKPYMERRTYATFAKQWPGDEGDVSFQVTSPQLSFEEYFDEQNPREWITSVMIGDLVRIKEYPAKGFQIEQEMPEEVWEAARRLIKAGYDKHLP